MKKREVSYQGEKGGGLKKEVAKTLRLEEL